MNNMQERLKNLHQRGFNPKCILDIGAHIGNWTKMAKTIFTDADFYLFEANPEHEPILRIKGLDFSISLLGDTDDKIVDFFSSSVDKWKTGNSILRENTSGYQEGVATKTPLKMSRLDTVLAKRKIEKVDFIKMDVQGAELLVLDGAPEALKTAEVILLETSILQWNAGGPLIQDVCAYMSKKGFTLYDIVDLHYLGEKQLLFQVDLIFIKDGSSLFPKGLLC